VLTQCARPSAPAAPCRKIEIIFEKNLDENHWQDLLRVGATVRADHFDHERVQPLNQSASRLIIMLERASTSALASESSM